jgi:hypothetical protein
MRISALILGINLSRRSKMGYGKQWKVAKSKLESLIMNADENDDCFIGVWNSKLNAIADSDSELWLKLSGGWDDDFPDEPPPVNPTL